MCVAAFGKIVELKEKKAVVSFMGVMKEVSITLLPKVKVGDSVVVHAGFATEIVKEPLKFYKEVVSTDAYARHMLDAIQKENEKYHGRQFRIMNFCGTHENTIVQYGLRELLPSNIELLSGPGCPVCVTPEEEIAMGLEAAGKNGIILTTYGDLLKVPTQWGSLEQMRAQGANIKIVYDINQALQIAKSCAEEVVHFAVGFETTAPGTAAVLKEAAGVKNFSILSAHRITPPAMEYVLTHSKIDALICPGHVAMVTGTRIFDRICREYRVPGIITGFEPVDVLQAILIVLQNFDKNEYFMVNQYERVVKQEGNELAQSLINEVFKLEDANWRGIGVLPGSRLVLKPEYDSFNAELKLGIMVEKKAETNKDSCICGEVLQGVKPLFCPNFGKSCTPENPKGPCMVSKEGACSIAYMNLGM
jgi:hydrogenase expression/formation protein HypD